MLLDIQADIKKVRFSTKMLRKLPQGLNRKNHVRVAPDYNSDGSCESTGSQRDRTDIPTLWGPDLIVGPNTLPNKQEEVEEEEASEEG